ncbi:O-antigen ligase [Ruminiclostridium sufflavum DSM 19573]|uniref:O-antigen ligase n=1 Tax=Ruminiclostridium sufflavum DSM 19573 TaxID=1121337 RepID=A0A318XKZ9_9FIRM|nr:O-antigen ligase family protein [Ruminiclostridium sufflavum]PYG88203.1 O-antigen ligase [Ruminiclostridium sufflavum DSM 19573]
MWKYVSNSLLFRFLMYIYNIFSNAFSNSLANKCLKTLSAWNQSSLSYKAIQNYMAQMPKYAHSKAYRFLAFCGSKLDKLAGCINSCYLKAYKNSLLCKIIGSIKSLSEKYLGRQYKVILYIILALALCTACLFLPKLAIAGIIGVLAVIFILRDFERAAYLISIYPILYYIAVSTDIGSLASIWDELLIIFCIGVWFYRWLIDRRDFAFNWSPVDFSLFQFFFVAIVLFVLASFDSLGFDGLRANIEYLMFFFIVVKLLRSENGAKNVVKIMIFTGIFMSVIGIYQYIAKVETPAYWTDKVEVTSGPRVFSIVGSPNVLGCLLAMLIPLAVSLMFSEKKLLQKLLYTCAAGLMGICILLTGSRSSWIALGLALIIYALLSKRYKIIAGLVVVAALAYSFVPTVQSRISYMLDPEYIISSFRGGRFSKWPKAMEMFLNSPVFGTGFGLFGGAVATNNKVKGAFYVDNYYLKAAVEMGIFGFIAFMTALYNGIIWPLRAIGKVEDKVSKGIVQSGFGAMIGILFTNIVLNNFDAPSVTTYFWTISAVCVYLGFIRKGPSNVLTKIIAQNESI